MDFINEEIRDKNLEAFKKACDYIPEEYDYSKELYKIGEAKNGKKILYVRNHKEDEFIRMNSLFDPEYEASRWMEKFEFENMRSTAVILGISSGYFIRAIIRKMRVDTVFVIYEPNEELLRFVIDNIDISDILSHDRVVMITSHMGNGVFYEKLKQNIVIGKIQAKAIITPGYSYDDNFFQICKQITVVNMMNVNYQRQIGQENIKNIFYAFKHLSENKVIYDMRETIKDINIPAIIVAAGPSLNKNVEDLKKAKGKALIIAVDRAVSTLQKHGIEPDIVSTVDSLKSPKFLDYDVSRDKPLITAYAANIDTQKKYNGRMIYIQAGPYLPYIPGMKDKIISQPDIGGSVATASFLACADIGIKNIILVGQDLAMLGDQTHSDGSDEGTMSQKDKIPVKGVNGDTVYTHVDWKRFKDFFESQIDLRPEIRVIDATEGGAYIEGTEVAKLSDVIERLCTKEYNIADIIDRIPYAQSKEDAAKTEELIDEWIEQIDFIKDNSDELVKVTEQLYKICRYGNISDIRNKKKIDKFDKLRVDMIKKVPVYKLLTENWFEEIYLIPDEIYYIRNNEEGLAAFKQTNEFYKVIPEYCDSFKAMIKEIFEKK